MVVPRVSKGFLCVPGVLGMFQGFSGSFQKTSGAFQGLSRGFMSILGSLRGVTRGFKGFKERLSKDFKGVSGGSFFLWRLGVFHGGLEGFMCVPRFFNEF